MSHTPTYYKIRTVVRIMFWVPLTYVTLVGWMVVFQ